MSSPATLLPPVREEYERPLEPLGELEDGVHPVLAHPVDDRAYLVQRRVHVHGGAGQEPAQLGGAGQRRSAQVDSAEHGSQRKPAR